MNYVTPKYAQNSVVYLVIQNNIYKCIVLEIIIKYLIDKTEIIYSLRPYGLRPTDAVQANETELYATLNTAKQIAHNQLNNNLSKEKLQKAYRENLKKITEKYEPLIKNYKKEMKKLHDFIDNVNDATYDEKEENYQKSLTEKDVENVNESPKV